MTEGLGSEVLGPGIVGRRSVCRTRHPRLYFLGHIFVATIIVWTHL